VRLGGVREAEVSARLLDSYIPLRARQASSNHSHPASNRGILPLHVDANQSIKQVVQALEGRWGLDALWVFGSQASGNARPDSDLDIAALFRVRPSPSELLDFRGELERVAGMPVDIVDIESASPILAMQVLRSGKLLVDARPARRVDFVAHAPGRYEDLKRIRRPIELALVRRVTHG
jgi:uncharacterized protein